MILRQKWNKIKRKRKNLERKEHEEVNELLKTFEDRINKRLKKMEEAGEDLEGFEEVEVDE